MITPTVKKKLDRFLKSAPVQEKFLKAVLAADPSEILWPELAPNKFGRQFVSRVGGKSTVYPLLMDIIKIQSLEYRINSAQKGTGGVINPSIAYYFIRKYEFIHLGKTPVKTKKKSARISKKKTAVRKKGAGAKTEKYFVEDEFDHADILERLKKIKRKLSVSAALKKAKDEESLLSALLADERKLTEKYADLTKKSEAAQIQLSYYKNPDFMHRHHQKKMEQLEMELEEYASLVRHESSRADLLEREVERLTEQIIAIPFGAGRNDIEELDSIRKEYSILSQKYDTLVSKNIDLSNRLERESSTKSLESLLDSIRNKINATLKSGISGTKEGDTAILHGLKSEVAQLK